MYKSLVTGAMAVGAVAVNQGEWFTENVENVKDTAVATLNEMTPSMKDNLKISMSQLADGTTFLGDAITGFLDIFKAKSNAPTNEDYFTRVASNSLTFKNGVVMQLSTGKTYDDVSITASNNNLSFYTRYENFGTIRIGQYPEFTGLYNSLVGHLANKTLTPTIAITAINLMFPTYSARLIRADGTLIVGSTSDIYNHLDNFLRDHAVPQMKDAGIVLPEVDRLVPGTRTRIDVNPYNGEMSLDGVGYNGDFEWSTSTKLGVNTPVPIPSVNGADLVFNPSTGTVYNPDGSIVNDLSNVTWRTPDIVLQKDAVTGLTIPTITTITGAIVNILTGEIISNPPKKPDKTNPKTKKTGKFQDIIPIALLMVLLDLIRAIIYYLIRLFNYIATMPFIPAQSINNPTFDWFVNTKFLGIYPFKMAMNFASFCFAFVVYKVIRRNF